jgi:transcriptional regulator with XRE-family HTH domain
MPAPTAALTVQPGILRAARLRRGLTQAQVGRLLEPQLDGSLISRYESGLRVPQTTLLQLVALLQLELAASGAPSEPSEAAVAS